MDDLRTFPLSAFQGTCPICKEVLAGLPDAKHLYAGRVWRPEEKDPEKRSEAKYVCKNRKPREAPCEPTPTSSENQEPNPPPSIHSPS